MGLIHDLCYHIDSRAVEGYVERAKRILSVDGCGSPGISVSSKESAASLSARPVSDRDEGK